MKTTNEEPFTPGTPSPSSAPQPAPTVPPQPSSLIPQPSPDPLTRAVILGHQAVLLTAKLNIVLAVWTGQRIQQKKDALGHANGFTQWRDALPFGHMTAAKYMVLAREFGERHPELSARISAQQLQPAGALQLPEPQAVTELTTREDLLTLAAEVHKATTGATLTGLYEELGIIRRHKVGGNPVVLMWVAKLHPSLSGDVLNEEDVPPELREEYEAFKKDYLTARPGTTPHPLEYYSMRWNERIGFIREFVLDKEEFKQLSASELRVGYQALNDCLVYIKRIARI